MLYLNKKLKKGLNPLLKPLSQVHLTWLRLYFYFFNVFHTLLSLELLKVKIACVILQMLLLYKIVLGTKKSPNFKVLIV